MRSERVPAWLYFPSQVWRYANLIDRHNENLQRSFLVARYHVCEYAPPGNVIGQFP